jgi:predicted SAM-dependent methyltransferase
MQITDIYNRIPENLKGYAKRSYFFLQKIRSWITPRIPYPVNDDGKVFIHLGCGSMDSPEFINVDGRYFPHIHHTANVEKLPFFPDNFADLVYSSHTLEHIKMDDLIPVLKEWKRILKPGGILRLSVPDFDCVLKIYNINNNTIDSIHPFVLGGQDYKENHHYSMFNKGYLESLLFKAGFMEIRQWDPADAEHYNFNDWASRKITYFGIDYPISLNLEALK